MRRLGWAKARFWAEHRDQNLSPRQRKVMNLLLDAGPHFGAGRSTRYHVAIDGWAPGSEGTTGVDVSPAGRTD